MTLCARKLFQFMQMTQSCGVQPLKCFDISVKLTFRKQQNYFVIRDYKDEKDEADTVVSNTYSMH